MRKHCANHAPYVLHIKKLPAQRRHHWRNICVSVKQARFASPSAHPIFHSPSMSSHQQGPTKAIFYALGANGGIAIAKFAAAIYTGSGAMLAEAIHSLADCANQLFLLRGLKEARKPPNELHPMGYGRVVYFWALMVALLLFFLGGVFSVYQGVGRLRHGGTLSNPVVALAVLGISVALEGFSLSGAMREIRKIAHGRNFFRWFRETRQSELMVVAGEDVAALTGLSFAFVAILLTVVTGNPMWDAAGSIAIGVLLMVVAVFIMREVKAMITGESAVPETHAAIKRHIEARPEVDRVINLITLQLGANLMVAVQAKMQPQITDVALVQAINRVEESIQRRWPQAKWCFFEPDFEAGKD
jgi:cation diffusion facilitator family transporter